MGGDLMVAQAPAAKAGDLLTAGCGKLSIGHRGSFKLRFCAPNLTEPMPLFSRPLLLHFNPETASLSKVRYVLDEGRLETTIDVRIHR